MIRVQFPGGEVVAFPEGTPKEYLDKVLAEYNKYGSFEALNQRVKLFNLPEDPSYLELPRLERHRRFNEEARSSDAYWGQLDPKQRRQLRFALVDVDGANQKETHNLWDVPIKRAPQPGDEAGGVVNEFGNAFTRSLPKTASYYLRDLSAKIQEGLGYTPEQQPTMPGINYSVPAVRAMDDLLYGTSNAPTHVSEALEEMATDLSVGAELLAPPPKVGQWGDVHGWDDFAMYVAQGLGQQVPIMGSIATVAAIPGIGTAAAYGAGQALETGTIAEDLKRAGFEGKQANRLALTYGAMAGALEALPIADMMRRVPLVGDAFKKRLLSRVSSAVRQAFEEGVMTEPLQTLVENTAVDVAYAHKGDLEKVSWLSPEGRKQNLWEAVESGIQGLLIGTIAGGALPGERGPRGGEFEGPAGPAAPTAERLLPTVGGPVEPVPQEGAVYEPTPEESVNMRWGAAPTWLPDMERMAWARGDTFDLPAVVEQIPELTMEQAIGDLNRARQQVEQMVATREVAPQEEVAVVPTEEEMALPEIPPTEAPVPVPVPEAAPTPVTEGERAAPTEERFAAPENVPYEPTPEELAALGAPTEPVVARPAEETEIDRIAAREAEGMPAEVEMARRLMDRVDEAYAAGDTQTAEDLDAQLEAMLERMDTSRAEIEAESTPSDQVGRLQPLAKAFVGLFPGAQGEAARTDLEPQLAKIWAERDRIENPAAAIKDAVLTAAMESEAETDVEGVRERLEKMSDAELEDVAKSVYETREETKARMRGEAGVQPVGAVPAEGAVAPEVAPTVTPEEVTFKPKLKNKLKPEEFQPAVGAAIRNAFEKGQKVTATDIQDAIVDLTGIGKAGTRINKVREAISQLKALGVIEGNFEEGFTVDPNRFDANGRAVDTKGVAYGVEAARLEKEIEEQDLEERQKTWREERDFKEQYRRKIQVYVHDAHGGWYIPEEHENIHPELRAPRPNPPILPGMSTEGRGFAPDQLLEIAKSEGVIPSTFTLDDFVEWLSKEGPNLGAGLKPRAKPLKAYLAVGERPTVPRPPTLRDMRRSFKGWAVRQIGGREFQLTRKGQPILHFRFEDISEFTEEQLRSIAQDRNETFEELQAEFAAGLVIKGHYQFNEATGAHVIGLIAPHATPKTLYHEAFHFAFHNVLNAKQRNLLIEEFGTEEAAADGYADFTAKEYKAEDKLSLAERAFKEMRDWALAVLESVGIEVETAESLMRKLASGDIYELQEGRFYTRTSRYGAKPEYRVANAIVNAEMSQEIADREAKLQPGMATSAIQSAQAEYLRRGYYFYSAVADAIANAKQDSWKSQSFLNWLRKQPGIKEEEIYWTGLEEYVKLVGRVDKSDALKFMERYGLQIHENFRGPMEIEFTADEKENLDKYTAEIAKNEGYAVVFPPGDPANEMVLHIPKGVVPGRTILHYKDFTDIKIWDRLPYAIRQTYIKAEKLYYRVLKRSRPAETKWEQYQQPGDKQGYSEITMALPAGRDAEMQAATTLTDALREANVPEDTIQLLAMRWGSAEAEAAIEDLPTEGKIAVAQYEHRVNWAREEQTHESHAFPERNILVWVRFNERHDMDGKKVLFIEEIQSDWHQTGEKKGYLTPAMDTSLDVIDDELDRVTVRMTEITDEVRRTLEAVNEEWKKKAAPGADIRYNTAISQPHTWIQIQFTHEGFLDETIKELREDASDEIADRVEGLIKQYEKLYNEESDLTLRRENAMEAYKAAVPNAPFKGTAWPRLAMKRMLVFAADRGFDRIAWTPASMQVQMWEDSTRAVVDHIRWVTIPRYSAGEKFVLTDKKTGQGYYFKSAAAAKAFANANQPGTFTLTTPKTEPEGFEIDLMAYKTEGGDLRFRFKEDGSPAVEGDPTLEEVVGAANAKKILETPDGNLLGENLTIGGSGFKAFYDGALRGIAKKIGKKYKAKVGTTRILGIEPKRKILRTMEIAQDQWVVVRRNGEILSDIYKTRDEANKRLIKIAEEEGFPPQTVESAGEVHSMDISPDLRTQIMTRGLELFDMSPPMVDRTFDPETMYSLEVRPETKADENPAAMLPDETLTENIRQRVKTFLFQKIAPIVQVQEKLTKLGEELNEAMNGFLKAQNFSARAGALLDWLEQNLFDPFINTLSKEGISLEDFDHFRMAAHALERNPRIYDMYVTRPRAQLNAKIKELEEDGISIGMKVRAADRNNVGTIKAIDEEAGVADVFFLNQETGKRATVTLPIDMLEREGITLAKQKLEEIDRMVKENKVPHSGIPDDQAVEILKELRELGIVDFEGEPTKETTYKGGMARANSRFTKIVRWKENTLLKSGLLDEEQLARWRMYRYYAPMRGKDADIMDAIAGGRALPIPEIEKYGGSMWHRALDRIAKGMGVGQAVFQARTGRGYNPGRRPASERALGRTSFPQHSATVELFTDAMEAAVRSEKNRVAKAVWNFAQKFKTAVDATGQRLFEINQPAKRRIYDEKTGTVKEVADGLSVTKDNVYTVWIDGKIYYIRAISPQMAPFISALNNIGPAAIPKFLRSFSWVNRQMSALFTSRNPAFAIPNAIRDALTTGIKLAGEKQFEGFGLSTMTQAPQAWLTLAEYARRQTKGTLDQMDAGKRQRVEDWKLAGGETAFWMIPNLDRQARILQKRLQKGRKGGDPGYVLQFIKNVIPFLEDYNGAIEGTMRFSVYERALDMGVSRDKAARLSRAITVDFTQQGTVARALSPFYIFANASLQGSKMVYDSATKNPKARMILASMIPIAITHALAMRALGGDDPDDGIAYWDKISAYEKSRNLILMIPGTEGKRIKIPLPWGFNIPWLVGTTMADTVTGAVPPVDATARILSAGLSAFNPIGDNDLSTPLGWRQMVIPSWADPINDVISNRTFWGGPIRPEKRAYKKSEQYGLEAPDYNNYFSSVSKPSKEFTKFLYKHTGIDINPENLDYLAGGYLGGLGDLVDRGTSLILSMPKRRTVPMAHELPIIKSFYGDEGTFFAPQMYRGNMADHYLKWEIYKDLEKTDPRAAVEYFRRHRETLELHDYVRDVEARVRELKKQGVAINDSRMQKTFKNFNRRYNAIEKKKLKRTLSERK